MYSSFADQLADNGYDRCIPLRAGQKAPRYKNWELHTAAPVSDEQRAAWVARGKFDGIGCAAGGSTFGLDLDHKEQELAFEVRRLADLHIGETPVWRVGEPHKSMRFYRQNTDAPIATKTYRDLDIGLYGTTGQWVLYGNHPITKKPYTYPEESPLDVHASDLPLITETSLANFLAAVDPLIVRSPDAINTGAGRNGVASEAQDYWETAKALNPTIALADAMTMMMRQATQRHPTMTGIVAFLCQCGWNDDQILDAIGAAYLDHFSKRELPSRWASLKRSIAGAHKKNIALDMDHLVSVTCFSNWSRRPK